MSCLGVFSNGSISLLSMFHHRQSKEWTGNAC